MGNVLVNDASLQDVANAIREKNGLETKYKPAEMGQAIRDIPSGGGDVPPEALVITGDCKYKFAYDNWNWFIENYGDRITTEDITDAMYMFNHNPIKNIPFSINFTTSGKSTYTFFNSGIEESPIMTGYSTDASSLFNSCKYLRNIQESTFENFIFSDLSSFSLRHSGIFTNCYSLRNTSYNFATKMKELIYVGGYNYSSMFNSCCSIDSIIIPCNYLAEMKSNRYINTFNNTGRCKSITFDKKEDDTCKQKLQVIDLTSYVGWSKNKSNILDFNSGITADKEVTDAESYEALKNDPDWFTMNVQYSRYNHDSAVETINSLPDTSAYLASAGGTNTVKFKGQSGELTDGGAINTLTEEEIAVAAAKGWTVSLV